MYTAVIADDEVWIRKWLEQVLSNYDKEIRVAASLDDGLKVSGKGRGGYIDIRYPYAGDDRPGAGKVAERTGADYKSHDHQRIQ